MLISKKVAGPSAGDIASCEGVAHLRPQQFGHREVSGEASAGGEHRPAIEL